MTFLGLGPSHGARLIDVGHDLQLEILYRDATHICAYYPVHTILRDTPKLRAVLADAMADERFSTYDMVVGDLGRERLDETFYAWGQQISKLQHNGDHGEAQREMERLTIFLRKLRVRHRVGFDESKSALSATISNAVTERIFMSFFYVTLWVPNMRRSVLYLWDKPFGKCFETVEGALVLEDDSKYLNTLYFKFLDEWHDPSVTDVPTTKFADHLQKSFQRTV